jgi:hypothetical protein
LKAITYFHHHLRKGEYPNQIYPEEIRSLFGFPMQWRGRPSLALKAVVRASRYSKKRGNLSLIIPKLRNVQRQSQVMCLEAFASYGFPCDQVKYVDWCMNKKVNRLPLPILFRYGIGNMTMDETAERFQSGLYNECRLIFPESYLFDWSRSVCLQVANAFAVQALKFVHKNHVRTGYATNIGHARAAALIDSQDKLDCLKTFAKHYQRLLLVHIKQCTQRPTADASSEKDDAQDEHSCAICLEDIDCQQNNEAPLMEWPTCNHMFHRKCAYECIKASAKPQAAPCPLCRQPYGRS